MSVRMEQKKIGQKEWKIELNKSATINREYREKYLERNAIREALSTDADAFQDTVAP